MGGGATGGGATVAVAVGVLEIAAAVGVGVSAIAAAVGVAVGISAMAEGLHFMHKQQSILSLPGFCFLSLSQVKYSEKNFSPVSSAKVSTSWKGKFIAPASLAKSLMC